MRWIVVFLFLPAFAHAQLAELCGNDADDDGDSLADCGDPDCADHPSCASASAESTARDCRNGADDDADGTIDCDDASCGQLDFCLGHAPVIPQERRPTFGFLEVDDPRRYPQAHVEQPLTYLSGMLVPELGLSVRDAASFGESIVHLGLGLTYGILDYWEIAILPVPVRLSPSAAYEDPSISSTLRMLDHEVVEVGLYANVAIPVASDVGEPEPLPTEHLLARSRSGDVAELDGALLVRFHIEEIVRIDLAAPVATFVFSQPEARVDLAIPLRIAVQVSPYAYVAAWSGVIIPGPSYEDPKVPLGFAFGTTIPGWRRGPAVDASLRFGWPTFYDRARTGEEVAATRWQITLGVRVFTYLLP